jgi:hypothetical protein
VSTRRLVLAAITLGLLFTVIAVMLLVLWSGWLAP